ncbi:uroplakin-3b-like isoform X2 [Conger conger]|uniref:uroplakin-3b-like isoform X2 n=1 Tax=Conger conger TaxID=82655 RepID=UPI002A5AA7F4|nr:uroplakin-3b-like isoform X2 [Conger conger]
MAPVAIAVVLVCVWLGANTTEVPVTPEISSTVALGILTSRTMMLRQPQCYFDEVEGLPCSSHQCEIWLVVARGVQRFEGQKTSSGILSASPYPDAFLDGTSPNFFITRLGVQSSFLCAELPGIRYFRVGSEGRCDTTNCNGVLPTGATIRVKYILVDPANKTIESGTRWSQPITLLTPRASSSIDDSTLRRSGAMVVITVILSCSLAVLTLLLVVTLLQGGFGLTQEPPEIPEPPSLSHGIRRYNTHNLNSSEYYSNIQI